MISRILLLFLKRRDSIDAGGKDRMENGHLRNALRANGFLSITFRKSAQPSTYV